VSHDTITRYWFENDDDTLSPCYDVVEWAQWLSRHDPVVAITRLGPMESLLPDASDHTLVSTIFVGTQPDPLARPAKAYETVAFSGHTVLSRKLSSSRDEATQTHQDLVTRLSSLQ